MKIYYTARNLFKLIDLKGAQIAKDKIIREELNLERIVTQIDMLDKIVFDELFITYRASMVGKEMVWLPRKVNKTKTVKDILFDTFPN